MCNEHINNEVLHNEEYVNYQTGEVLDIERVATLSDNSMLKVKPDLWCKWNFEKNEELGYDIWGMTKGSSKIAWWVCNVCNDTHPSKIPTKVRGSECSVCSGRYVTSTNSLATNNPELAKEWHPTLNGELTPHDVTVGSSKQKVWWLGECGHFWDARIADRHSKNSKCNTCYGKKTVLVGFNDMWTTNPELAKLLANPEDGYTYTYGSNARVDWKCPSCGEIIKDKTIKDINQYGLSCPMCSDGFSFSEKVVYYLLKQLDVYFEKEKTFTWTNNKRYDFYIPSLNTIIELHGMQHYNGGFERVGGRNLEEEQSNDQYKYELAIQNSIKPENYIVIDCRKSEIEFIKENILNSRLAEIFDLNKVDWDECNLNSQKPMKFKILELWNKGLTGMAIKDELKIHEHTLYGILKNFETLGLCVYDSKRFYDSKTYRDSIK